MTPRLRLTRASGPAALVIAVLALIVALGGTSYAAVTLSRNSVGSKQLKNNAVVSAKVKDHSLSATDFAPGQLPAGAPGPQGERGLTGTTGTTGTTGLTGAAGTARGWAQVNYAGTVVRSGGLYPPTVVRNSNGVYSITGTGWGTASSPASFIAGLVNSGSGEVTAVPAQALFGGGSAPAGVLTYNSGGSATDHDFIVILP